MSGDFRFLLDEDIPPRAAEISRGLGLDVQSVHDLRRLAWSDESQLRAAARDGRIVVTYNRDDFIDWTREFYRAGEPHAGVLIVSGSVARNRPDRLAHALHRWAAETAATLGDAPLPAYFLDFISTPDR